MDAETDQDVLLYDDDEEQLQRENAIAHVPAATKWGRLSNMASRFLARIGLRGALFAALIIVAVAVALLLAFAASRFHYVAIVPDLPKTDLWRFPFATGDLVLTSDRPEEGRILSMTTVIKMASCSPYHHALVAYVEPVTGQTFFWEINMPVTRLSSLHQLVCGRPRHRVFVRRLNLPIDTALFERAMEAQWNHMFHFDFHISCVRRLRNEIADQTGTSGAPSKEDQATSSRTCAHLAAELYERVGVLDLSTRDAGGIFPADYARTPCALPMANGYRFGPLIELTFATEDTGMRLSERLQKVMTGKWSNGELEHESL
ncbi:hypothetical protein ml_316 [Mollivirus sibericum]|uniref:hypothetical protein n=1 Tax=Mollivirus sibericum TaxID=1678078 RepID=UPI0006B2EB7E|nr:hypothetical protein ml_316 [Mollivirus sibericum]ALD62118.1 hypothetical protein ml_316 [Mollivirus sibericum]